TVAACRHRRAGCRSCLLNADTSAEEENSQAPGARPFAHEEFQEEKQQEKGLIGVSEQTPNSSPQGGKPAGAPASLTYDAQAVEAKWQKRWAEARVFETEADTTKPKYYVLEMLPYPSGTMHMGHMRNYAIGDVVARVKRMRGFNVLHPMGWDAFGLPAENAAIKNKTHPRTWTNNNIAEFQRTLRRFGFSYDWRREISTCEPEYYRWNQWFFLRMLERGLAYRKKSRVNWCPKCATVLANEQVVNGYCWRHEDTFVETRELEQ